MENDYKYLYHRNRKRSLILSILYAISLVAILLYLTVSQPDPPLSENPIVVSVSPIEYIELSSSSSSALADNSSQSSSGDPVLTSNNSNQITHNSGSNSNNQANNQSEPIVDPLFTFQNGDGKVIGDLFTNGVDVVPNKLTGPDSSRKVLKDPCKPSGSADSGTIFLKIIVDDQGRVIHVTHNEQKSSTTSVSAIDAAKRAVKDCMLYSAKAGASSFVTEVKIVVSSN